MIQIHEIALNKLRDQHGNPFWEEATDDHGRFAVLHDVPLTASHTLVHYLYTGAWQMPIHSQLPSQPDELALDACFEVLAVAYWFGLKGLVELAQAEIASMEATQEGHPMCSIQSVGHSFSHVSSDWLGGFVQKRLEKAEEDPVGFFSSYVFQQAVKVEKNTLGSSLNEMILRTGLQLLCRLTVTDATTSARIAQVADKIQPAEHKDQQ